MKSTSSDDYERFREMLVEARRKSGLSQQEIADRLGRPQTYVSKCELGTRRMDVVEFLELAHVTGFDPVLFIKDLRGSSSLGGKPRASSTSSEGPSMKRKGLP